MKKKENIYVYEEIDNEEDEELEYMLLDEIEEELD